MNPIPLINRSSSFHSFHFFLFCFLCLFSQRAAGQDAEFAARLVRVADTEELTEEGTYAFVGMNERGEHVALTSATTGNGKLRGVVVEEFGEETMVLTSAEGLWRLERVTATTVRLLTAATGSCVTRMTDGLGLRMDTERTERNVWELTATAEGTLLCAEPGQSYRALGVAVNADTGLSFFDNYVRMSYKRNDLYVFRLATGSEGTATTPRDGAKVAIAATGRMRLASGVAVTTDAALLCNGMLAPVEGLQTWTADVADDGSFTLRGEDGYLDYELSSSTAAAVWEVADGHLRTRESVARYLRYDEEQETWRLTELATEGVAAFLTEVAERPARMVDEQGVCTLTGGWTASALAEMEWDSVRCLDLTQTHLPRKAQPFAETPATRNLPVFVNAQESAYVPSAWRFVVVCGTRNELLGEVALEDGEPVYTDRAIHVDEGAVTYGRTGCTPGRWQTICLPFDAKMTAGTAYGLTGYENGELTFAEAERLTAGTGYIVLPDESGSIAAIAKGGDLQTETVADEGLGGVFARWTVTEADGEVYFLTQGGETFRRAAAGSSLPPFRAFLRQSGVSALRVRFR